MAKTYSLEDFASEPAQTFSFADFEEKPKTFSLADFESPKVEAPTPTPVAAAPAPTPEPTPVPAPTLEPAPVVAAPTPALTPAPTAQVPQDSPPYEPAKPTGFMSTLKEAGFGAVPENPNQYIPQAYKGIMSGVVGLGSLWEGVNIGADASALNIAAKQLSNFDQIDAGTLKSPKQFLGKPSSQTWIDNAQYMSGDEATRAALREKYAADIGQRKEFIQSSLATLEKYKEFAKQYKGRVEDFTSVEGVRDFTDWLKFNMGSAGVQLAPIIIAAVTTGGLGAGLVGMSMAGGEQINNRIAFVLNQKDVKTLAPEQQAIAVEKYVQDTMGVSMSVAAANGALDAVTGPVGAILRAKFAKEAAKAAGKEITGDVALKQAVKEIPRSVIEESFTGLTQEAFSILGEKYLGEQNLDFFDPENRKRLINAMASEGVGGLVGGGFNVGAAAKRFQTASEETKAQLNKLGQTLLNSVEGSSFTKEGIDAQAVDALNPNQKVAPTSLDDMAPPLARAVATEQKTTPPIGAVTTPPEEETPVSKAASYVPAGTPVQQKAAPPEQPAPKVVEYIDMETGEIIPSDQADPRVEYTNRETGEVIPPTEVKTTEETITPEIEQQIKDEAARYAREYNLPLDLATDIIRGQHARGDLDAKRTPAKSVTGRIEPSFSVLEQGTATAQGVAPSDTTGLAGPVEDTEPPVAGEGTKPAPLGDIPTLTERPPAATYAQLDPDSKAGVLQEAQGMWESGEANLPMAKAWNSLPSWKRDMFAQEVYANYDEMTTNGEVFRAAMDKVIQAKKPEEAKAPEFKADVQAEMPFAAETPAAPVGPVTFAELPKAEKDTVMETAKNVWQTGEISLPIEKSWNSLPNWKRELFAERVYAGGEDFVNDRDQWYGARREIAGLEKNPATTKEPATKTAEPITGFKTSKGSEYVVDETGKTSRTKKSPGEGQGETFAPHNAVYVDTAAQNAILEDMQGLFGTGGSIRIGYVANNAFNTISDLNQLPKGVEPVVAVINTQTKQAVAVHKASTQPEIGLHPVEKLYNNDGTSSTHLGNDITELTKAPAAETPKTQAEINKERQAAQKAAAAPTTLTLQEQQKALDQVVANLDIKKNIEAALSLGRGPVKETPAEASDTTETPAAKKPAGPKTPTMIQQREAFAKSLGAAREYRGSMRGRKNNALGKAVANGDIKGAIEALAQSKNKVIAEFAKRLLGTNVRPNIIIDNDAIETYDVPDRNSQQVTIDTSKTAVELLDIMRGLKSKVEALPDDNSSLGYDIYDTKVNIYSSVPSLGEDRTTTLSSILYSDKTPIYSYIPENKFKYNSKGKFLLYLDALEKSVQDIGEEKLRRNATATTQSVGVSGAYNAETNEIAVPDYRANNEDVVAHELVHAQAIDAIANPAPHQREAVKRLNTLFKHVQDHLANNDKALYPFYIKDEEYGLTSIQEFAAEGISNPAFQFLLSIIPYENTSAWGKFAKTIADLLGIKNANAFTEFLNLYDQITQPAPVEETPVAKTPAAETLDWNFINKEIERIKRKVANAERVERRAEIGPASKAAKEKLAKALEEGRNFYAKWNPIIDADREARYAKETAQKAAETPVAETPASQDIPQNILDLHQKYERMTAMANERIPSEPNAQGVYPRPQDLKREETMSFRRLLKAVEDFTGDTSGEPSKPALQMLTRLSELSRAENEKAEAVDTPKTQAEINQERQAAQKAAAAAPVEETPAAKTPEVKAKKPTAKERKAQAEQKMFDLLGAKVGDTITFSQDIGYITANKPLVISSISNAGEMSVTDPSRGSSTSEKLSQIQAQAGRGLTWEVTPAEKPAAKPKGRRKVERTAEGQAKYEADRLAAQAELIKANRDVAKLIAFLSKSIDPNKIGERRDAIYQLHQFATDRAFKAKEASGKKAKSFLAQSNKITETERAALARRLDNEKAQEPKPLAAYAQTASEPVKAFYKFTTATQAISHIMRNGTPFERALAARLKPFLTDVRLIVADADAHPDIVKILNGTDKGTSASGAYSSRVFGNDTRSMIVLRGENFAGKPGQQGVNNVIFLHEALHAATEAKIAQYEKLIAEGKPVPLKLEEMISELRGTMAAAKAHYEKLKASGAPIPPSVRHAFETVGIATFPEEFVAYGMTNPDVQLFLLQAPGGMRQDKAIGFWKNLFNRFVNTMREAFDMDNTHQSALQDLMLITEGLMQLQETAPASTAGVQLAAKNLNNKITKADKDLKKVQQSHDLSGGIKLFKDAGDIRTFENYETLFKANWDSMAVSAKLSILGALPTSSIIDWKGDQVPALKRIDELVQRASGLRQNLLAGYARKADALGRFVSEHGDYGTGKLATAMHLARLSSVTPSVYADRADALANDPRVVNFNKLLTDPRTNPNELNAIKNKLNERIASIEATFNAYDALRPIKGAQDMYKMVRQFYKDANALTRTLLDQNIDKLQLEGNVNDPSTPKGKLMLAVRRMYEDSEFKGVEEYFPFMRHGDQRLDVAGPDGKETYFFDTTKERKLAIEQRAKQLGVKPNDGNIFTVSNESHADSKNVAAKESRMLTEMFRIIEDATAKPGVNKDDLKDQLYQVYLSTLPEASYRKQFMHAENVTGFTSDIFRNFQTSATRIANQATKLRYGQEVDNEIQAAKDTLEGMPPNMQEELKGFVNEVAIRAREEFDPRPQSRVANGLTQFAYYWLLSGAASAAIQTTALPIFVMSHLNPQYGYGKSAAKLARWMNVYNSMSFTTDTYEGEKTLTAPTVRESSLFDKNPLLQRAFDEALARNVINQLSGTPYSDSNRTPTNARNNLPRVALRETANLMSGLFTGAERLTREVAFMMTFELEYEKSGDFDKAVQKAVDMVHNQLGRFDTFDTPRLLRNGVGKVVFQFKPYAAVVTKIFVKGYLAATTPGQRSEGLQILSGILLMGAMLHGVTGMPLYTMICDVIDGILDDLEDDEKRKRRIARYKQVYGEDSISDDWGIEYVKDKEARIAHDVFTATNSDMRFRYEFLPKFTGGLKYTTDSGRIMDLAQMLEKGPVSVATDMNIGSRTSFNNIWLKEIREGKDFEEQVKNTVEAFTPPSISAVMNVVKGVSGMAKGETRKGIEQASPAAVANPLKAERVSREGITNKENELILGKSELSNANIVAQVTGLTSTRAAALEENKFKFVAENAKAEKRRQVILGDLKKAYLNESVSLEEQDKAQVKVNNQIDQYNRRYPVPGLIIDGDTISDTLGNAFEARGMSSRGMHINDARMPNLRALRERLVPGQPK